MEVTAREKTSTSACTDAAKASIVNPTAPRSSRAASRGRAANRSASRGRVRTKSQSDPASTNKDAANGTEKTGGRSGRKVTRIRVKSTNGRQIDPETARRLVAAKMFKENASAEEKKR